jgi:hypothetical protein
MIRHPTIDKMVKDVTSLMNDSIVLFLMIGTSEKLGRKLNMEIVVTTPPTGTSDCAGHAV